MSRVPLIRLHGLEDVAKALAKLQNPAQMAAVMRPSLRAAMAPVRKTARALVPQQYGNLRKHLDLKLKTYRRTGVVWAGVGPRTNADVATPSGPRTVGKYAHLAEYGRRAFSQARRSVYGKPTREYRIDVGAARGSMALNRALEANRAAAIERIRGKVKVELERLAARLRAKGTR